MRVAVVGLGFGAAVHVPALRRLEDVEVVALAGSDRARAVDAAEQALVPAGCGSLPELLALGVDAVTVAVPPARQAVIASALLRAGVPVLVEKPLAANVEQAEELARLGQSVTSAVDFEFAELATFRALHEAVTGGGLGAVRSVEVTWRTRPRSTRAPSSWKLDGARGGGVLGLLGSHVLYLLEWLFGPVEDIVTTHLSSSRLELTCRACGAPAAVVLDNDAGEQRHEWRVELEQETLTASNVGLDAVSGFRLLRQGGEVVEAEARDVHPDGRVAAVSALAARFVDAVGAGSPASPGLEAGLRVQRLMARAEAAAVAS